MLMTVDPNSVQLSNQLFVGVTALSDEALVQVALHLTLHFTHPVATEPGIANCDFGSARGIFNLVMLFTDENQKPLQRDGEQIKRYAAAALRPEE